MHPIPARRPRPSAPDPDLFARYQFFQPHTGAVHALALARAEREAHRRGWRLEAEEDPFFDPEDWPLEAMPREVWNLFLYSGGRLLGSCLGVVDPDLVSARILGAALCREALARAAGLAAALPEFTGEPIPVRVAA